MNCSRFPQLSASGVRLCLVMLLFVLADANLCQAQWLPPFRSAGDTPIQYAPDDPQTRGRFFNLQTGHAGAFYNCDGEESKRCSPWIRWQSSTDRPHRTFEDVLQWARDRAEIAQRICDGAGDCCSGSSNCSGCLQCDNAPVAQTTVTKVGPLAHAATPVEIEIAEMAIAEEPAGLLPEAEEVVALLAKEAVASVGLIDRLNSARRSCR